VKAPTGDLGRTGHRTLTEAITAFGTGCKDACVFRQDVVLRFLVHMAIITHSE
jgi:hypothetical protein